MCGLLKILPTRSFLIIRLPKNSQQMFLHRNLLLSCHPLGIGTHHSLQKNIAQCCILLHNSANNNKKQHDILIQSRGLRHNVGGSTNRSEEKEENAADSSSSSTGDGADKMDPQKLESEFKSKFAEFMLKYREDVKAGNARMVDFMQTRNKFMEKFNEEHAKSGYKIERTEQEIKQEKMIQLLFPLVFFLIPLLFWVLRPRGSVKLEHKQIVAQPPLTFDQFVREYLPTGEVDFIFHYPAKNLAVAILHPGAIINGVPFNGPGLHIALDEAFRHQPMMALTQRVRQEEHRIGVRDTIPIATRQVPFESILFYYFGTLGLCFFFAFQMMRFFAKFRNRMFRAVPIKGGGMSKTNEGKTSEN